MKNKLLKICLILITTHVSADVKDADNKKIISLLEKEVSIIDIRRPAEWHDTGVIEGSILLTFFDKKGNYNIEEWLPRLKKVAKEDDPVIIICRSGRRSGIVAKFLDEQANYSNVYNASGGILSWIGSKNKIVIPN